MNKTTKSEKEAITKESLEGFLLDRTSRLRPSKLSEELKAVEAEGGLFQGGKFVGGFLISNLLKRVSLYFGAAWTPLSVFLSIQGKVAVAHLKLNKVESEIEELAKALLFYAEHANVIASLGNRLLDELLKETPSVEVFSEINDLLGKIYQQLLDARNLGKKADGELRLWIPTLIEELDKQGSAGAKKVSERIQLLRIGEYAQFTRSLNRVRSTIHRLES